MDWVKIIHILCVMGWMTSIFAVPRALIYWRREWDQLGGFGPLGDLTIRLYRFSAGLMVIGVILGLWLAIDMGMPAWTHWKLTIVFLLMGHYGYTGKLVMLARQGQFPHSDKFLRWFNETSVIATLVVLWLVVAQPF